MVALTEEVEFHIEESGTTRLDQRQQLAIQTQRVLEALRVEAAESVTTGTGAHSCLRDLGCVS